MNRPKMCGNCGKLMGVESECPYCGASRNDIRQLKGSVAGLFSGIRVTQWIIYANVAVYVIPIVIIILVVGKFDILGALWKGPPYHAIFGEGVYSSPAVLAGSWMSLITANFLHMGLLHIFFNCYTLQIIGPHLEQETGPWDFWVIYMFAGIGGFLVSALAGNVSGGASAAIFGVIGAHMALSYQRGGGFHDPVFQSLLRWAGIMLVLGLIIPYIDNYAHFGGMVFGGLATSIVYTFRPRVWWRKVRVALGMAMIVLVLWGFIRPLFALLLHI